MALELSLTTRPPSSHDRNGRREIEAVTHIATFLPSTTVTSRELFAVPLTRKAVGVLDGRRQVVTIVKLGSSVFLTVAILLEFTAESVSIEAYSSGINLNCHSENSESSKSGIRSSTAENQPEWISGWGNRAGNPHLTARRINRYDPGTGKGLNVKHLPANWIRIYQLETVLCPQS